MPIYRKGKQITSIYHNNKAITEVYHRGRLVFTTKKGWVETGTITYTVNANNNNSVAGSMTLRRYDYYEGTSITKTYYEVSNKSLSRETEGVLTLTIPAGSNIVFGSALNSAEYPVPSSGIITLSASEFANLYRINKNNGILNLTSRTISSYYLEPVQDMTMSVLGSGLFISEGWAIAHNRSSRIKTADTSISTLNLPSGDGMWPIFAVASGGTDVAMSTLTCATNAHYVYESQNIRHMGWVVVQNGNIVNVLNYNSGTAGDVSKSIEGSTLTVGAGYAKDTSGCRVYVPGFTYSISALIDAAKDKRNVGTYQTIGNDASERGTTGVKALIPESKVTGSAVISSSTARWFTSVAGPCMMKVRGGPVGTKAPIPDTGFEGNGTISKYRFVTASNGSTYIDQTVKNIYASAWVEQEIPENITVYYVNQDRQSITLMGTYTWYVGVQVATITITQGTRQVTAIYAKVTRNQNNNSKSVTSQTSTGTSVPFVSYVQIGTITVERNADTGTIS